MPKNAKNVQGWPTFADPWKMENDQRGVVENVRFSFMHLFAHHTRWIDIRNRQEINIRCIICSSHRTVDVSAADHWFTKIATDFDLLQRLMRLYYWKKYKFCRNTNNEAFLYFYTHESKFPNEYSIESKYSINSVKTKCLQKISIVAISKC